MREMAFLGFALVLLGFWAMLTRKNILRIIIGFTIIDSGIHLIIVNLGYLPGRTAPILEKGMRVGDLSKHFVDPIPSALVLTAIVIGLAVTALMLVYAVRIYERKRTLNIDKYRELKW
ncbi:MAG: NADH-quinone oxidoreductase subunit K [Candidatus Cloacimonetes bacterium]|nr:NADH-quinone oxidoreductase subunit K [Candidatus Cloacimonadota bacterium]